MATSYPNGLIVSELSLKNGNYFPCFRKSHIPNSNFMRLSWNRSQWIINVTDSFACIANGFNFQMCMQLSRNAFNWRSTLPATCTSLLIAVACYTLTYSFHWSVSHSSRQSEASTITKFVLLRHNINNVLWWAVITSGE